METKQFSVEDLMMLAIEESRRSIPEHQDKTDPLVGAIVATATGEILARAHRGELRIGEHCEFTLIERKLRSRNLQGCVLYVTLEPCTDESRKSPKRGCSTHVVKARLSKVYVGLEDPNPKIATKGIRYMEGKGINVHMFPDHLAQMIRSDNAQFIREKELETLQALQPVSEEPRASLETPVLGSALEDLSSDAIQAFLRVSGATLQYPSKQFNQWMIQLWLAEQGNDGTIIPTSLGLLLLGAHPEHTFPQAVFRTEINYGRGEPEIRDFSGPLVQQLPAILSHLRDKALRLTINRSQGSREEQTDFPFEVLREAVANAIIHRDYTIEGATNYLYIDAEKIVIRSPGEPFAPVTLQEMAQFDAGPLTRNPKIMFFFIQMKLAEQRGIGLRNMRQLPQRGYPLPVFVMRAGALQVTFGRIQDVVSPTIGGDKKLSQEDQTGLLFIQERGEVTVGEYAAHLKILPKTAQRHLARLVDKGIITTIGSKRWTKYRLKQI